MEKVYLRGKFSAGKYIHIKIFDHAQIAIYLIIFSLHKRAFQIFSGIKLPFIDSRGLRLIGTHIAGTPIKTWVLKYND